eukprot:jgi/Hompol1/5677/HPOL_004649-RA
MFEYREDRPAAEYEAEFYRMQESKASSLRQLASANAVENAASFFEYCVDKHAERTAVVAVDHAARYTFRELDAAANRIARWAQSIGLKQLDTVALLMENRPEFLAMTMGFAKIGVTIALINTNLKAELLHHAISVSDARAVIVSIAKHDNWASLSTIQGASASFAVTKDVYWYAGENMPVPCDSIPAAASSSEKIELATNSRHHVLSPETLAAQSAERLPPSVRDQITSRMPLYYIFTSGTTGPSKAAKFSHRRFIGAAVTWAAPSGLKAGDCYYITLPLYHGNAGVVAVAPCYLLGNTIVLREKFSVSNFFKDIRAHNASDYPLHYSLSAATPNEATPEFSPLRVAIGNGLRNDIWTDICTRFHITQIVEHYGSTEMPGDAVLNYFNKPGSCGFLPISLAKEKANTGEGGQLIQYDVDEDEVIRSSDGWCVPCEHDQVGEMIMRLPGGLYDGYVGETATRRKLYNNVFQSGDVWWSSGDLLRMDAKGFFYFVDRTGDSFRWKGENVSTQDVQNVIGTFPGISEVNVYGVRVPHTDGRAGMASIMITGNEKDFDFGAFTKHLEAQLPSYARPLFVRLRLREHEKTSTLKFMKSQYVRQGFDPKNTDGDSTYVFWPELHAAGGRHWRVIDSNILEQLNSGANVRF